MPDGEAPIAAGPNLTGSRGRSARPMTTIGAKVNVDGLKGMAATLKEIAGYSKEIRRNFEAINNAGRSGGFWRNLFGRGAGVTGATNNSMPHLAGAMGQAGGQQQQAGPQLPGSQWGQTVAGLIVPRAQAAAPAAGAAPPAGGTPGQPPATGGTAGNSMPWLSRTGAGLALAATGANMLSGRIGRNLAESAPISAQSSLLSSMYGGMISPYQSIEMQRFRDLGRYGGTRQDQAATQAMALRMGQTPTQAGTFMQGVGNVVQAMGGTMTAPQVAQATGGFLEPMVLRRQAAQGMRYAREGGQVRNVGDIAKDYISNYETRRNGGVKLNMFDMINLQTPGAPLRITFGRLYGLDDESIDMIATIGMQNLNARGGIDYNSQASVAAAGMDRSRLGLATASGQTTRGRREANFLQRNEGGMVTQVRIEEDLQEALMGLENATSGLTNAFAALDRVIQTAITGFGVLVGLGAMGGMGGGGGILGKFGAALSGLSGMRGGAGAVGNAGVQPAANIAGGGRAAGVAGAAGSVAMGAAGAALGATGIMDAANSGNGGIFGGIGQSLAGGAMLGGSVAGVPGAVVGTVAGGVLHLTVGAWSGMRADDQQQREEASMDAGNQTDKEILDKYMQFFSDAFGGHGARPQWDYDAGSNEDMQGQLDRFHIRRAALISQFMAAARESGGFPALTAYIAKVKDKDVNDVYRDWSDLETKFGELAADDSPSNDDYKDAGEKFIELSDYWRQSSHKGDYSSYQDLQDLYASYFDSVNDNPMRLQPIYTEPAFDIIDQYSFSPAQMASPTGDPEDQGNNENSNTTNYAYIDRMPMAEAPSDRSWGGLDPRMKKRLLALFAASGGQVTLGGGGGTRSTEQQRAMFLDRYTPSPDGKIEWEGKRWKHVKGAAAAPPGRSMHEIGLAADLAGPGVGNGWLKKNAKRFGLKEFSNVNDEPWHVQPAELPNSRREYEGGDFGSWGTGSDDTSGAAAVEQDAPPAGASFGGASGIGGSSLGTLGLGTSSLGALQGGVGGGARGGGYQGTGGATTSDMSADVDYSGEGPLTGKQVAQLLYNQGFRGENLIMALAISKRESGWDPGAFNGNTNTGDKSYGLFQINMIGDLGPARREQYGLSKDEELFDPKTNIRAAYMLSSNGTNFHHWGGYKGEADNYNTDMGAARSIISSMGLGDAAFDSGVVGTGGLALPKGGVPQGAQMSLGGGRTPLNVNVTIQSTGNYPYDAKQLAKHVRPAFEQEYAEVTAKRSM